MASTKMEPIIVTVDYTEREGWHVFTSEDMQGLYVATNDLKSAFVEVPAAIKVLMQLNYDLDCEVRPAKTFAEFAGALHDSNHERPFRTMTSRPYAVFKHQSHDMQERRAS